MEKGVDINDFFRLDKSPKKNRPKRDEEKVRHKRKRKQIKESSSEIINLDTEVTEIDLKNASKKTLMTATILTGKPMNSSTEIDEDIIEIVQPNQETSNSARRKPQLSPPPTTPPDEHELYLHKVASRYTQSASFTDDDYADNNDFIELTKSEDLLPELAARVRQHSGTRDWNDIQINGNGHKFTVACIVEPSSAVVDKFRHCAVVVDGKEKRPRPVEFRIKNTSTLTKMRKAWLQECSIPMQQYDNLILIDQSTAARVYDSTTPFLLRVPETDPVLTLQIILADELDRFRNERSQRLIEFQNRLDENNYTSNDGLEQGTFPVAGYDRIVYLQDDTKDKIECKTHGKETIRNLMEYYRERKNVGSSQKLVLIMDDEELAEDALVEDLEIEDEDTIDVKWISVI
ncbi:uncharacterized protein V1516DRAFT_681551 [Lipomyces oligophaga]|uniref:uncharacterized protein n=1 Tax=Lipomyces oligophaga TaxID=45792 RepID=UPI0034CE12E0